MASPKNVVLQFTGNLDIRQAESMLETLKQCKDGNTAVIIDLKEADDIDFAIIQMLFSFKKTLNEEKREVTIRDANPKIESKINLCDFQDLLQGS